MRIEITTNHSGKMENMQSLSTSCLGNALCKTRKANKETICNHCYAMAQVKRYTNLNKKLERNTEVLTSSIIPVDQLPFVNATIFRLEAFGDLNNDIQVINYFNFCEKNAHCTFAIWTKNPWLIKKAIEQGYKKPENLIIIFSSVFTNKVNEAVAKHYDFIDKVFTVFDKDHSQDVEINCGSRKCNECRRCYTKTGNFEYINELVK